MFGAVALARKQKASEESEVQKRARELELNS
jgi:hypothetical protein